MEQEQERIPLLTIKELARQLNVSPKTIRNLRVHGLGPQGVKIGGSLRWRQETVDRYLDDLEAGLISTDIPTKQAA